mmetsp:Transcript_72897/g.156138  ORF Transcript_72897/g.156138 Transcript_72897/m.156138 type:complete len:293 (-) Transcript_72897:68-946(-)
MAEPRSSVHGSSCFSHVRFLFPGLPPPLPPLLPPLPAPLPLPLPLPPPPFLPHGDAPKSSVELRSLLFFLFFLPPKPYFLSKASRFLEAFLPLSFPLPLPLPFSSPFPFPLDFCRFRMSSKSWSSSFPLLPFWRQSLMLSSVCRFSSALASSFLDFAFLANFFAIADFFRSSTILIRRSSSEARARTLYICLSVLIISAMKSEGRLQGTFITLSRRYASFTASAEMLRKAPSSFTPSFAVIPLGTVCWPSMAKVSTQGTRFAAAGTLYSISFSFLRIRGALQMPRELFAASG